MRLQRLSNVTRLHPRAFGQHHRGIGRQIAMPGIARRLDRHIVTRESRNLWELVERSIEVRGIGAIKRQGNDPENH
jgi:hypothetical protein